jgi:hypothetical protein
MVDGLMLELENAGGMMDGAAKFDGQADFFAKLAGRSLESGLVALDLAAGRRRAAGETGAAGQGPERRSG